MCVLERSWYLLAVRPRGHADLTAVLDAEGYRHYCPIRAPRPAPLPNRPNLKGDLFPGHLFAEIPFSPDLYTRLMGLPGVASVVCNERGRPFHIPNAHLSALAEYCALGPGESPSGDLHLLDLLGARDRVEHFLSILRAPRVRLDAANDSRVPSRLLRRAAADKSPA